MKVERKTDVGDEIRVGDEADRDGSFASIGQKTARKRAVLSGFEDLPSGLRRSGFDVLR